MTEAEWLECNDPTTMLEFLRGKASDRKFRLFASAICGGVDLVERHADGNASDEELEEASLDYCRGEFGAKYFWGTALTDACKRNIAEAVYEVVRLVEEGDSSWYKDERPSYAHDNRGRDTKYNVGLVHCVFGPLVFRPVFIDHTWLTSTVRSVAQAAYDNRTRPSGDLGPSRSAVWAIDPGWIRQWGPPSGELDAERLAVLSDALEDAGCGDADILGHLRSPGPHVPGCWALDRILGNESI